ncbi:MAG: sucrase ferredoxin [Goleter apudmare HA4340-LM2]|jgi:hypothetical protein|nr:sucrase ferredoxin [Goleter apudmare HA4340-LM2]
MTTQNLLTNCQFCSKVSKTNGEDPIGTAKPADTWIIIEMPQPWTKTSLMTHSAMKLAFEAIRQGAKLIPIAIAPDQEYSVPGLARLLHYQRSPSAFAQYDQQEFLVPETLLPQLTAAILHQPEELHRFEPYQQFNHTREMMVCTHGNIDVACSRFGYPIYQKLRQDYAAPSNQTLRVWRCSHFGGHQFAPTLVDLPTGQFWGHLEPDMLDILVQRDRPVTELRQFYRGWSGLTQFEQIVERDLWMQYGWDWLNYKKSGQMLALDTTNEEWNADWADVRLDFTSPDGNVKGSYQARIETCGHVMTLSCSGNEQPLQPVKQYRVTQLTVS